VKTEAVSAVAPRSVRAPGTAGAVLGIAWRELRFTLSSPVFAVVAALFLLGSGAFFAFTFVASREAVMRYWFLNAATLLLLFGPLLSMRTIAEEERSGSLEALQSSPVTDSAVVIGKFLGTAAYLALVLAATTVYWAILTRFGDPEAAVVLTGYIGLYLYGMAAVAVGVFCSSLTRNQVVAGSAGFVILLALWVFRDLAELFDGAPARWLLQSSTSAHLESFVRGAVELDGIIYFCSVIVLALFAAGRMVERRRW